jgi:putative membrane protein
VGLYSALSLLHQYEPFAEIPLVPLGLDAALSFAMGFLIAFRVNRAYERWWEARTQWGILVNVSRNLAIKIRELAGATSAEREDLRTLIGGFAYALKDHLRKGCRLQAVPGFADDEAEPSHVPAHLSSRIYRHLGQWRRDDRITDAELLAFDRESRVLMDVCGACERIKTTLMSMSWRRFTKHLIFVYLLVLPWGLVDPFGAWTAPMAAITAYFVIGGEAIAMYVEEPFGEEEDHLDLDGLCDRIAATVSEILSEEIQ